MKKFKGIIALCLAAAMSVPIVSVSAFTGTKFNIDIPFYPDSGFVNLDTNKTSITLGINQSSIVFKFAESPKKGYIGIYDVTENRYITAGTEADGYMVGPYEFGTSFAVEGLTGGHTYRIYMGGDTADNSASGIVYAR